MASWTQQSWPRQTNSSLQRATGTKQNKTLIHSILHNALTTGLAIAPTRQLSWLTRSENISSCPSQDEKGNTPVALVHINSKSTVKMNQDCECRFQSCFISYQVTIFSGKMLITLLIALISPSQVTVQMQHLLL